MIILSSSSDLSSKEAGRPLKEKKTENLMAEPKRYAVVTGSNKGIGFEICRQLASNGIVVVLTARDENRGLEAVKKLHDSGLTDFVLFHQLDVKDSASVASLAEFIKTQLGKLDILVNNAGIGGVDLDGHALGEAVHRVGGWPPPDEELWKVIAPQSPELAKECFETNYYGAKRVTEALLPLLQLTTSAKIVNVSSSQGLLKNIPGEWIRHILDDAENLTEDVINGVLESFMEDFRQGVLESKGWPRSLSAYTLSKAAMNAYTRVLAKMLPSFMVNSVCPGFTKTDITANNGVLTAAQGAESPTRLALLSQNGPSGFFFVMKDISSF